MRIRTYHELSEADGSDLPGQLRRQEERVAARLSGIRRLVAVTSGKGGVGKSLVAAGLAAAAAATGRRVGLLDADLNGPTAARLLGADAGPLEVGANGVRPADTAAGVALMATSLFLGEGRPLEWREPGAEGFVWRGVQERGTLREFLSDVAWGERDLLVVDLPPGAQRLLELAGLAPDLEGAVAVTLPSGASRASVERALALCEGRGIRVLGIVENMAGYACPGCSELSPLFPGDAGRALATRFGVPLLGRLPFDPGAAERAEAGDPAGLLETAAGRGLRALTDRLLEESRSSERGARREP